MALLVLVVCWCLLGCVFVVVFAASQRLVDSNENVGPIRSIFRYSASPEAADVIRPKKFILLFIGCGRDGDDEQGGLQAIT
jgi:hypothetical protein